MSCITEILKIKGDKNVLHINSDKINNIERGIVVEGGGNYKGYEYLITFNDMGFRCGYVAISPDHPTFNDPSDYPYFSVHGGITFFDEGHIVEPILGHTCTDKWLGFDCTHAGDSEDLELAKEYFKDNNRVLDKIKLSIRSKEIIAKDMELNFPGFSKRRSESEDHRTKEYVEEQCKFLIDQLIEVK